MTRFTKIRRNKKNFSQNRVRRIESLERRDLMAADTVEILSPHETLDTDSATVQISGPFLGGEFNDKLEGKDRSNSSDVEGAYTNSTVENIVDSLFEGKRKDSHSTLDTDSIVTPISRQFLGGEFNDKLEGKDGSGNSDVERAYTNSTVDNIVDSLFEGKRKDNHNTVDTDAATIQTSRQYFGGEFNDKLEGKE